MPSSVSTSVVLPAPFGPISAMRCPLSMWNDAPVDERALGDLDDEVLGLDARRASSGSVLGKPKASALSLRGASTRSMRSSSFCRDCAWRERVPALNLATKRSRRAISSRWRSNASAWFCSASARSRR